MKKTREAAVANRLKYGAVPDGVGYLCSECAEEHGGKWPEGHCATFHESTCELCGEQKYLCCVSDWNWSDGKERGWREL